MAHYNPMHHLFVKTCEKGDLEGVKRLLHKWGTAESGHSQEDSYRGIVGSATNGHLDVLEYLCSNDTLGIVKLIPMWFQQIIPKVVYNGHTSVVKYMLETHIPDYDNVLGLFRSACEQGHLGIIKYFMEECNMAHGFHDWLVDIVCSRSLGYSESAYGGHLDVWEYLSEAREKNHESKRTQKEQPTQSDPSSNALISNKRLITTHKKRMYYDDVKIEDFVFNSEKNQYEYPCPCGNKFIFTLSQYQDGEEVERCPGCSLVIKVVY